MMGDAGFEHDPGRKDTSRNEDRFARDDTRKYSGRSSVGAIVAVAVVVAIVYLYYHWSDLGIFGGTH